MSWAERRARYPLLLIFAIMALAICAGGFFSYRSYERHFLTEIEQQLAAIAELKVEDLALWRKERLGDADTFFKNASFSELVRRFLDRPGDAEARAELRTWLHRCQAANQYDRIVLLDAQGVERLSTAGAVGPVAAQVSERARAVLRSRAVGFQDFYRNEHDQRTYLATLVPVLDGPNFSHALGILVLHIDPTIYPYSFISRWPTPSRTAETLLVRRDGNDALFLSELRFQTNTALKYRIPLARTNVAAVKAALGQEGIIEGIDYRGVPVVAALRAVPGSPWFLVARMDTAEVYAPLRERLWVTILLMGSLLLGTGASVGIVSRQQHVQFFRERYEAAEAIRESEAKFRALVENIPQKIFIKDRDLRWVSINENFARSLGIPSQEVAGKVDHDFFPKELADKYRADDQRIMRTGQAEELEEKHVQDGRETWVHVIKTPVRDGRGEVTGVFGIFWDITARKQTEEQIQQQLDELRRWQAVMLGREDRNMAVKREVNELLRRLGEPIRYPSVAAEQSVPAASATVEAAATP
jgi:PAS domain S-box-containing protein